MKRELPPLTKKEDALAMLFERWAPARRTETVPLSEAAGRVLAEDQLADWNIPVVRASAMDGIAVRADRFRNGVPDTSGWVIGKDYVRADTGDDFPDEFDTVIAIEDVTVLEGGGIRLPDGLEVRSGDNVRPCGSDVKAKSLLKAAGAVLTARDLAVIGLRGVTEIPVVRKPRVAFLPTGSELVPVGAKLQRGKNYDTNSLMAQTLLRQMGAEPVMHEIVPDDPDRIREAFEDLLSRADIVLLNAGTSKGSEDYCARLLAERGETLFHGAAAVPGRPMSMAVADGKAVVNLSGPTVGCLHSFYWAVRPIICRALGIPVPAPRTVRAVLTGPVSTQKELSKMCLFRIERDGTGGYTAEPLPLHGPKAGALTADGIYMTEPGEPPHGAGDTLEIEWL